MGASLPLYTVSQVRALWNPARAPARVSANIVNIRGPVKTSFHHQLHQLRCPLWLDKHL